MKVLQELLGLIESQEFDVYAPHSYGSGFMDEPLDGGEYLTDEAGYDWEFISVTKDGKKLLISRNGKKEEVSPSKFGAEIRLKEKDGVMGESKSETHAEPTRGEFVDLTPDQNRALEHEIGDQLGFDVEVDSVEHLISDLYRAFISYYDPKRDADRHHGIKFRGSFKKSSVEDFKISEGLNDVSESVTEESDLKRMQKQNVEKLIQVQGQIKAARKALTASGGTDEKLKDNLEKLKAQLKKLTEAVDASLFMVETR